MTTCNHLLCSLTPADGCQQVHAGAQSGQIRYATGGRPPSRTRKRTVLDAFALGQARAAVARNQPRDVGGTGRFLPQHTPDPADDAFRAARKVVPFCPTNADVPKAGRPAMADLRAYLAEATAEQMTRAARRSFAEFFRQAWSTLEPGAELSWNWHLEVICNHLQWMFEEWCRKQDNRRYAQAVRNLIVNIPPRSAKTKIIAIAFPAWVWLHRPSFRFLCISGTPKVVNDSAFECRALVQSAWYQQTFRPDWGIADDQSAKTDFRTTAGGRRIAIGATARYTGLGADAILCDDPNDAKENTDEIREKVISAYKGWRSRVNSPKSSLRIVIQQRLHERDLTGYLLDTAAEHWDHLKIPLLFESAGSGCKCPSCTAGTTRMGWRDPRTVDGELLHEDRYPPEVVAEERSVGEYYFAGQFQQRPAPDDGGIFKKGWWKWFDLGEPPPGPSFRKGMAPPGRVDYRDAPWLADVPEWVNVMPDLRMLTLSIDSTFGTENEGSDFNSLLVVGRKGPYRYVLDNITMKMTLTDTVEAIKFLRKRWGRRLVTVLVELKANGQSVVDGLKAAGVQGVIGFDPKRDNKRARAQAIQPFVQAGDVCLPKGAPWVDGFLHEFTVFPNGAHDDQVDALSQCLIHMHGDSAINDFVGAFSKR